MMRWYNKMYLGESIQERKCIISMRFSIQNG